VYTPGSDTHFQIALTSEHVAGFGVSSVHRARKVADEKKKKKIAVKLESADDYVNQPHCQVVDLINKANERRRDFS